MQRIQRAVVRSAYHTATHLIRLVGPLVFGGGTKIGRGMRGRGESLESMRRWARASRDRSRPLVWAHAPSVGEGIQAREVMRALRDDRDDLQVAYTHFSPAAESFAGSVRADTFGYSPWDLPGPVDQLMKSLAPDVLVFTKTEVWPTWARAAQQRGVPVVMIAATLSEGAKRLNRKARPLMREVWPSLDGVLAISAEDADRFAEKLQVPRSVIQVCGDPGVDAAVSRVEAVDREASHLVPFLDDPSPTVVAGSTWRADEEVLLPALAELRRSAPSSRVVIAPHEPTTGTNDRLTRALASAGWRTVLLSTLVERGAFDGADAVVVDGVGQLADLYVVADAAYVGGGFHRKGLHNVLEPVAAGALTTFGPLYTNSRPAERLVQAGGAKVAASVDELTATLSSWLNGRDDASATERAAAAYIEAEKGAARRTAESLSAFL